MVTIIYTMVMPGGYGCPARTKQIRITQLLPDEVMIAKQNGWVISRIDAE